MKPPKYSFSVTKHVVKVEQQIQLWTFASSGGHSSVAFFRISSVSSQGKRKTIHSYFFLVVVEGKKNNCTENCANNFIFFIDNCFKKDLGDLKE